jgi:hypothetical protein
MEITLDVDKWDKANDFYWALCIQNKVEPVYMGEREFYENGEGASPAFEAVRFFNKKHGAGK